MMNLRLSLMAALFSLMFAACQQEEPMASFTGRTISYPMIEGTYFDQTTNGTLTVKEKADGTIQLEIKMNGTMDDASHPVHLHHGSLLQDETVAQYLSPLVDDGNHHSVSITELTDVDGKPINFEAFQQLNASIKVHFQETGEMRDVILGATNIGINYKADDINSLGQRITTCTNF